MEQTKIDAYGDELYDALKNRTTVIPFTERESDITIEDGYQIQQRVINRRIEQDGERVVGKKIGVTSKAVQDMLGVHQPDFGYLMSSTAYNDGDSIKISDSLIQPKMEGEIAFILKKDLTGPGVTNADVLSATDFVMACFEICDSRIQDWKIKIQDTVADNASAGAYLLGDRAVAPDKVDLKTCGMILEKNGEIVSLGAGAATLGHPLNAVAWLANTLGQRGIALKAGEVILSGSLAAMVPAQPGDHMRVVIGGIGSASVVFT
ncbi:MAG: 2-oxopent-4-enoate hydratase [Pseudomonadota bacterium]|nr:2-oxopent-4-enoate hydratase [Pseudomonadota bacterium]